MGLPPRVSSQADHELHYEKELILGDFQMLSLFFFLLFFLLGRYCSQLNGFERPGDHAVFNFDDIRNWILDKKP